MLAIIILLILANIALSAALLFVIRQKSGAQNLERTLREEFSSSRTENANTSKLGREELNSHLSVFLERLDKLKDAQSKSLDTLRTENTAQLEKIRETVNEKLETTLEKRLGASFKLVQDSLGKVGEKIGEMQNIASSVKNLGSILTNVKTRGTWGEVQLDNLISDILTPEQFDRNVETRKGSNARVEFAVRMPGRASGSGTVWLPVDAKFPVEDYQRLLTARDELDKSAEETAVRQITTRIKLEAKSIREKYICPPDTTDFALMFLPTEGLFAEILRVPGLFEEIQKTYRVIAVGPTTLSAVINSLSMGFKTLAIEKRSSEVWMLLGAVKTEFGKFAEVLSKTLKKIKEAENTLDSAHTRTRAIERQLRKVESMPDSQATLLIGEESGLSEDEE